MSSGNFSRFKRSTLLRLRTRSQSGAARLVAVGAPLVRWRVSVSGRSCVWVMAPPLSWRLRSCRLELFVRSVGRLERQNARAFCFGLDEDRRYFGTAEFGRRVLAATQQLPHLRAAEHDVRLGIV